MTQTILQTAANLASTQLITVTWGDGSAAYYTTWSEPLTISSVTYLAEPRLDIKLGQRHGGTEDRPTTLTMPRTLEPFATIANGRAHAPVNIKIEEVDPATPSTRRFLWFGPLKSVIRNPGGRPSLLRAIVGGLKDQLQDVRLSFSATTECQNLFGGDQCRFDIESTKRTGVITAVGTPAKNVVTFTSLSGVSNPVVDLANLRYRRGRIRVEGLTLMIRASLQNLSFEMFQIPPASWVGKTAQVLMGCDGTLAACRAHDREINFNGLGIATPDRNPLFED